MAASNYRVSYRLTRFLSITVFCKGEVALLALSSIIRKSVGLKVVSKLILKKLLDYNGFGNV